jgi:ATP synthase protein I
MDDKRAKDLDEQLKAARADFNEEHKPANPEGADTGSGSNIGYEFLAYVISGGLIGYVIDYFVGTLPWGLILFIILGFVGGVYRANDRMKNSD